MKRTLGLLLLSLCLNANESYYKNGQLVELENTNTSRSLNGIAIDYYKTQHGQKVGITDEILLECKDEVKCSAFLNSFQVSNYSKLTDTIFVIKMNNYDNIFSLSRKLFQSGKVKFAHPNFIKARRQR